MKFIENSMKTTGKSTTGIKREKKHRKNTVNVRIVKIKTPEKH